MMNIVLATDDNFVQHCGTAMMSIVSNNSSVNFYILTEGLTHQNKECLKRIVHGGNRKVNFCIVPSDIVSYFPMSKMASGHISIATYYRLFVTSLLPSDISKILYLDCDMIVRDSLDELWNIDITGKPLAAVYQHNEWADHNYSWGRLNIPRECGYFNAGCLIMNLDYLREDNFQKKAIDYINVNFKKIISHDQDVLNALYHDKTLPLSCKWNFLPLFLSNNIAKETFPLKCQYKNEIKDESFNPIIIHFVSKPKPWDYGCSNPYKNEYFKYLRLTPWKDYKVNFSWGNFCRYVLFPLTRDFLLRIDVLQIISRGRAFIRKRKMNI